ncbi:MAG: transposase [Ignavibacteria bacterium]|nr:transposase [Ignavibacteria bacterium]
MLIISDGGPGLKKAIEDCFPESKRQRCIAHKLRNIANKLNEDGQQRLLPLIKDVYYQTDHAIATMIAMKLIDDYSSNILSNQMFSGRFGQLFKLHEISCWSSPVHTNNKFA